jgi:hypothetical protein
MNKFSEELRRQASILSAGGLSRLLTKDVNNIGQREFFEQALALNHDLNHKEYDAYCETLALFLADMSQYDIDMFLATFKY